MYEEALRHLDADKWVAAMNEEIAALMANNTWKVDILPAGVTPIPTKWVYKLKRDAHGNIERDKATRLFVKG